MQSQRGEKTAFAVEDSGTALCGHHATNIYMLIHGAAKIFDFELSAGIIFRPIIGPNLGIANYLIFNLTDSLVFAYTY